MYGYEYVYEYNTEQKDAVLVLGPSYRRAADGRAERMRRRASAAVQEHGPPAVVITGRIAA